MFTEEFLATLQESPSREATLLALCEYFLESHQTYVQEETTLEKYDEYLEAYAAFEAFVEAFFPEFRPPELTVDRGQNISSLASFVRKVHQSATAAVSDEKLTAARGRFGALFGNAFVYEFSDGDLSRIQQLLNELREHVQRSEAFDADHKQRVLKRVESLQRELHKKNTSLDMFWGFVGEAGVALGKFGIEAKPFVDRIKEIVEIVWRTTVRAEELPSGTSLPLLAPPKSDGDE